MCKFGREKRVTDAADFQRAFAQAQKKIVSRYFVVPTFFVSDCTFCEDGGLDVRAKTRLGVVVSKKVSKRAVDRNRIKRVVRESFRLIELSDVNADVIVVAKWQANTVDNAILIKDLTHVWRKVQQAAVAHESASDVRREST